MCIIILFIKDQTQTEFAFQQNVQYKTSLSKVFITLELFVALQKKCDKGYNGSKLKLTNSGYSFSEHYEWLIPQISCKGPCFQDRKPRRSSLESPDFPEKQQIQIG